MKKILLLLLLPTFIFGQVNTFPWIHDFDNGIGLEQEINDDGDWTINQGSTTSFNTGPSEDHTTGSGSYYYVESSWPNYPNKTLITYTPTFDVSSTPGQVLSFWYHMYGTEMGDLEIGVLDNNGYTVLDIKSGNYGNQWLFAYYPIASTDSFKIKFTAVTGDLFTSDIAIDDLMISDPFSPAIGCMDSIALNYDPSAIYPDGSCTYPPCGGFISANAYGQCWGTQAGITFEWWSDTSSANCDVIEIHYGNENGSIFSYWGYWPAANGYNNFALNAGNGQMPPNWSVEHYIVLEYADGTLSDTITYTPSPCIPGCTDSTQISYNPFANIDDGSCAGAVCDPDNEYQITMTIRLDNWPGETSWTMMSGGQAVGDVPQGTYDYGDIGQTYTYEFCVDQSGFELILNDTYGDGIMGNGTPGSAGEVVIYDCAGDTITYLTSGTWLDASQNPVGVNFGYIAYSTVQNGVPCAGQDTILGCIDPTYQEYNPLANIDDSSCVNLHVYGCIDDTMFNYNPSATIMDLVPVCDYTLIIEDDAADGWGNSYLGITQGNSNWAYTMGPGSYSQSFSINLETDEPVIVYYFEVPGAQQPPQEVEFQTMQNSFVLINAYGDTLLAEGTNPFANNGQGALQPFSHPFWNIYDAMPSCGNYCEPVVYGCMDSTAYNYDIAANTNDTCYYDPGCTNPGYLEYYTQGYVAGIDDGSCLTLAIFGCTDSLAFNYDITANIDNGGCIPVILGCMNELAFNYNPNANTPDTCIPVVEGCTSPIAFNYDSLANTDDGSCIGVTYGCTDTTMWNYSPSANVDDGSCIPYIYGCMDPTMFNYDPLANTDNGNCIPFIYGCMDTLAFNYDPLANTDNGSCIPIILGCTNPIALNYCDSCNTDDFSCILPIYGCTDSTMFNFNPLANVDNNSCIPFIYGCTDPSMLNYNPSANTEDFSCIPYIYGCMDSTALNFDPLANTDNGSCVAIVEGCMDQSAYNYDVLANVHDSISCLYAAPCATGPGNPYWLNDPCYAWVISVDDYCCENEWDTICQLTYNHCEDGWTGELPISRTLEDKIILYPNPTKDIVNIVGKDFSINVYNNLGQLLITENNPTSINLSSYSRGVYMLHIIQNNKIITKQIIKE